MKAATRCGLRLAADASFSVHHYELSGLPVQRRLVDSQSCELVADDLDVSWYDGACLEWENGVSGIAFNKLRRCISLAEYEAGTVR